MFNRKSFAQDAADIGTYAEQTFQPQDDILRDVRARAREAGLPDIHVAPMDGLHIEVLARSCGARRIVEIGTLAGYSGTCLARALPTEGRLYTFEYDKRHAEVAAETFRRAGVADKVKIFVGPALENLPRIEAEGPFDLVFIDADKNNYPAYLEWSLRHLRVGGVILGDNTFAWGEIAKPAHELDGPRADRVRALQEFNSAIAREPRLRSTIMPTGEGLTFAVKIRD